MKKVPKKGRVYIFWDKSLKHCLLENFSEISSFSFGFSIILFLLRHILRSENTFLVFPALFQFYYSNRLIEIQGIWNYLPHCCIVYTSKEICSLCPTVLFLKSSR